MKNFKQKNKLQESKKYLLLRKKILKESMCCDNKNLQGIKLLKWDFNPDNKNFSFKCGLPNTRHFEAPYKIKIIFPIQDESNFLSEYNYAVEREMKNTPHQFINSSQNLSDLFQTEHFLSALKYHLNNQ